MQLWRVYPYPCQARNGHEGITAVLREAQHARPSRGCAMSLLGEDEIDNILQFVLYDDSWQRDFVRDWLGSPSNGTEI